jgi:hypothetical protein
LSQPQALVPELAAGQDEFMNRLSMISELPMIKLTLLSTILEVGMWVTVTRHSVHPADVTIP